MRTALIFFTVFPFVQILPLNTYNQPYAFLMAFLLLLLWASAKYSVCWPIYRPSC